MEQATTIQNIPLWMVNVSPMNSRKTFDQASLEELADNIKRQGLLQPITVRPVDYRDELTDGEVVSIPSQYEIVCGESQGSRQVEEETREDREGTDQTRL